MQVYFPESVSTKSFSLRYQFEALKDEGCIRLVGILWPSFNQLYFSGGAPFALHVNLTLSVANAALNVFLNVPESEKVGGAPKQ